MVLGRRARKRAATRQIISDVATRLFMERGFDAVTVDEIAEAADVGRKTVFNYFAQKEDMFFDLDVQGHEDLRNAIETRNSKVGLIETMRLFAHRAVSDQKPYIRFLPGSGEFIETIAASRALRSRAREIRDELANTVATLFAEVAERDRADPEAHLAASLLIAAWGTALLEAHKVYQTRHDAAAAQEAFLRIVDRAAQGLEVTMRGSPYV
jgi:AcrR family transcriptional regulator